MILIADSGSTKTDWVIIDNELNIQLPFSSKGLNPNILTAHEIADILKSIEAFNSINTKIETVFFYGAGCSGNAIVIIESALKNVFPDAQVKIKNDLFAAAQATCWNDNGIVCILGTGSNSCYYDGKDITGENLSLGFILGDEAGGVYFGKRLLRDYFYGLLPTDLHEKFSNQYNISREEAIENIYRKKASSEFIASFLPFYKENINHPYCNYFLNYGFEEFLKIFVWRFKNYEDTPVHFIGSVAFYFKDVLIEACENLKIKTGKIIRSPIMDLASFHLDQLKN